MAYITGECPVLSAGSLAQLPYDDKSAGEGVGERVRPAAVGRATRTGSVMGPGSEVSSLISRHVGGAGMRGRLPVLQAAHGTAASCSAARSVQRSPSRDRQMGRTDELCAAESAGPLLHRAGA